MKQLLVLVVFSISLVGCSTHRIYGYGPSNDQAQYNAINDNQHACFQDMVSHAMFCNR